MYKDYSDITTEYENIRQRNSLICDEKKAKIYKEHPNLKEIDKEIMKAFVNVVKKGSDEKEAKKYEETLSDLRTKRIEYLKKNNIKDDYREVQYTCKKCRDTGFVDGKKCSCFIEKEIELYDNISNFKKYIDSDNFSKLNMNYYRQDDMSGENSYYKYMEKNILDMKNAIKNIDNLKYNLILSGNTGTGKTFLARSIGELALRQNKSVLYLNVIEYIDSLKRFKPFAILCDLLILDDLGTEYSSEFSKTELNYIIGKRINDNKSTILTTNLMKNELEMRYLSPMISRITNVYKNVYLSGADLRGIKYAGSK